MNDDFVTISEFIVWALEKRGLWLYDLEGNDPYRLWRSLEVVKQFLEEKENEKL